MATSAMRGIWRTSFGPRSPGALGILAVPAVLGLGATLDSTMRASYVAASLLVLQAQSGFGLPGESACGLGSRGTGVVAVPYARRARRCCPAGTTGIEVTY